MKMRAREEACPYRFDRGTGRQCREKVDARVLSINISPTVHFLRPCQTSLPNAFLVEIRRAEAQMSTPKKAPKLAAV